MAILLADTARKITKVFKNNRLDIEWVFVGDTLYIVQTRRSSECCGQRSRPNRSTGSLARSLRSAATARLGITYRGCGCRGGPRSR